MQFQWILIDEWEQEIKPEVLSITSIDTVGIRNNVWAVMGDSKNRTNLAFTNNYRCLNQHCDVAT